MGLPVLRLLSSFMHAVATTPAELLAALFARFTNNVSLPRINAGSASASPFSGPAQRSLTLRPACSPSPLQNPLHHRLQPLRYLHVCSGCYRPERKLPDGFRTRWKTAPFHGARQNSVITDGQFSVDIPNIISSRPSVPHPKEQTPPPRKISASSTNQRSGGSETPAFSHRWPSWSCSSSASAVSSSRSRLP